MDDLIAEDGAAEQVETSPTPIQATSVREPLPEHLVRGGGCASLLRKNPLAPLRRRAQSARGSCLRTTENHCRGLQGKPDHAPQEGMRLLRLDGAGAPRRPIERASRSDRIAALRASSRTALEISFSMSDAAKHETMRA
jgi:hypothetical protein